MKSTDGGLEVDLRSGGTSRWPAWAARGDAPELTGVAHDFNNLLMVIAENARIARDEGDTEALEEVIHAARRGSELTGRLLAFARSEYAEAHSLDLNAALAGLERLLSRAVGGQVALEIRTTPGLPPVRCDQTQLERILLNLAFNARDAMPNGGRVHLETASAGACARLTVTDEGAGMDADVAARAFEPFFTTKPRGQGTGLGLASVVDVAHGFGGKVSLNSEPGRGTAVHVHIPFAEGSPVSR